MKLNIKEGQRVKTPSGLMGTVISKFETAHSIICEVEFDCGGLMHYNSDALIQIHNPLTMES